MELQNLKSAHLNENNFVAIELPEILSNKDKNMTNEVVGAFTGTDEMKIVNESEIAIIGNDEDRKLLHIVKLNFFTINYFDHIIEQNNPLNFVQFLQALKQLMILNISHGITSIFNKIIIDKINILSQLFKSENIEDNSTDVSSIEDGTGENT